MTAPEFVIWADSYDESVGGTLVLHALCARLNALGYKAALWPAGRPAPGAPWRARLAYARHRLRHRYRRGPFGSPVAPVAAARTATAIYPEIVDGNPFAAPHVVRWLLHRPGYHTGRTAFGARDLFFFYQAAFDDPAINPHPDHRLTVTYLHPAYRDRDEPRSGSCYLLRKGRGRPLVHDAVASTLIDGLSHEETAAVFNRSERFYCYDLYSMYAWFAALCGCLPIVVPDPALPREQWLPDPAERYGLAYGEEDVAWAIDTRPAMRARLADRGVAEDAMIERFVEKARAMAHASL